MNILPGTPNVKQRDDKILLVLTSLIAGILLGYIAGLWQQAVQKGHRLEAQNCYVYLEDVKK